ncbi:hypothetical protein N7468_003404 [Penicillium chermesinum]|uniref:Uncharacterized protein n=1 Tax=Penicillium chermesinum TaxID=63820 RepID=A0A9W9P6Y8_9EURO|nr:uncharacterized protein N7468_003404 [Penicillium chermesinum]KAJ5238785.1 hypothetical protein N7468_003404 [Penicillium chermesinum]KAJ6164426.1 hypothetical protein N7470_003098 [Penicillium chermesinum]
MASTVLHLVALSAALGQAAASFSLNVSGPSWDYTTKDLADSTSQACKDAYSAAIDCDETLVKLVASLDPDFNPNAADLETTCTTKCSDSLAQYVKNVKAACDKDGDRAGLADGNDLDYSAAVATVGEVFQYYYGEACAKNGSNYCYLTYSESQDWAKTDFPCTDECAVKFYENAHDQPGSGYFFSYFVLASQSSWWDGTFAGGYKTVEKCKGPSDASSGTSGSTIKTDVADLSTSQTSSGAATSATSAPTAAKANDAAHISGTTSAAASTATATSGASRLRILWF